MTFEHGPRYNPNGIMQALASVPLGTVVRLFPKGGWHSEFYYEPVRILKQNDPHHPGMVLVERGRRLIGGRPQDKRIWLGGGMAARSLK